MNQYLVRSDAVASAEDKWFRSSARYVGTIPVKYRNTITITTNQTNLLYLHHFQSSKYFSKMFKYVIRENLVVELYLDIIKNIYEYFMQRSTFDFFTTLNDISTYFIIYEYCPTTICSIINLTIRHLEYKNKQYSPLQALKEIQISKISLFG